MEFVETKALLSSVIFKTIMVPLHRIKFLVMHQYSSFYVHQDFPLWENLYQKNIDFDDFWDSAHF